MRTYLSVPLTAFVLSACAPGVADQVEPLTEDAVNSSGRVDRTVCEAAGGYVDRRGMGQIEICVHPYTDAGQACTDNQQCDGKCVTAPDDGPDGQIVGKCQADDALFGCYAEVVDGKTVRAICVD